MESPYDFENFIKRMSVLDYEEIIKQASAEVAEVEGASFSVKGAPRQRELGSANYASRIKAFIFFMQSGAKPGSANPSEFSLYKPVVLALVEKKTFKPEIMREFE